MSRASTRLGEGGRQDWAVAWQVLDWARPPAGANLLLTFGDCTD
ncbi:hypothetical protein [Streptomyces sp. NPDC096351]